MSYSGAPEHQRTILLGAAALVLVLFVASSLRGNPFENAAAIVMLADRATDCQVMRHGNESWQRVPCAEVLRYLEGTLHLSRGGSIGIEAPGTVSQAAIDELSASLTKSGYEVAGVVRVVFVSVPEKMH